MGTSTHILLDFTLVPANYQTASLLGGLEVIMNAVLGATMAQGRLHFVNLPTNICEPLCCGHELKQLLLLGLVLVVI